MPFLRKNIDTKGRLLRAAGAFLFAVAAVIMWKNSHAGSIALGGAAVFMAFEAAQGWCAARACGIKTKY